MSTKGWDAVRFRQLRVNQFLRMMVGMFLALALIRLPANGQDSPTPTASPSNTQTATNTLTPTATNASTPTPTSTPTALSMTTNDCCEFTLQNSSCGGTSCPWPGQVKTNASCAQPTPVDVQAAIQTAIQTRTVTQTTTKTPGAQDILNANPNASVFYFKRGVYSGLYNTTSNRTFIFEDGAIIDGVFHVAQGYGPESAPSTHTPPPTPSPGTATPTWTPIRTITWVENVKVVGTLAASVRVGAYYARRVSIDKIHMLEFDPTSYPAQANLSPPGTKGVHLFYGTHDFDIGEIDVDSSTESPALLIDTATFTDADHKPTNIHIGTLTASTDTTKGVVSTANTVNLRIDTVTSTPFAGSCGCSFSGDQGLSVGAITLDGAGFGVTGVFLENNVFATLETVSANNCTSAGVLVTGGADNAIASIEADGNGSDGVQLDETQRFTNRYMAAAGNEQYGLWYKDSDADLGYVLLASNVVYDLFVAGTNTNNSLSVGTLTYEDSNCNDLSACINPLVTGVPTATPTSTPTYTNTPAGPTAAPTTLLRCVASTPTYTNTPTETPTVTPTKTPTNTTTPPTATRTPLNTPGCSGGVRRGLSMTGATESMDGGTWNVTGSQLTVALWANVTALTPEMYPTLLSKWNNADESNKGVFLLNTGANMGAARMFVYADDGTQVACLSDGVVNLVTNQWHHIAATLDGSHLSCYVDGVQVGGSATWPTGHNLRTSTHNVRLGARDDGKYLHGLLDDVRIYDVGLSAEELGALYNGCGGTCGNTIQPTHLQAWWKLDEGSGTSTADSSGHDHAGTLVNGAGWSDAFVCCGN